jgi:peptide deformylase
MDSASTLITDSELMKKLELVLYPDPILTQKCAPVNKFNDELRFISKEMFRVMYESKGVGLAAPQVGLGIRMVVLNVADEPGKNEVVLLNPEISLSKETITSEEGCLSFPGLRSRIPRSCKVNVKSFDLKGKPFEFAAEGLFARAVQHECDHLDGITFNKRMGTAARLLARGKLKELERRYKKEKE